MVILDFSGRVAGRAKRGGLRGCFTVLVGFGLTSCSVLQDRGPAAAMPAPPAGRYWALVWHDEFDGSEIDMEKWTILGDSARRQGYWSQQDAFLDGSGHLLLRTRRENDRVYSGAVSSRGKFRHRFGLWMIRCKFGTQPGHWPAFWLYTESVETVGDGGRDGTEIDIVEKPFTDDRVQHNLHWDGYEESHQTTGREIRIKGISEGFHTFAVWWTPTEYVFFVDGVETWRTDAGGVSQVAQFLLITDEVDDWAGDIDRAMLPDYFVVDWVRVYSSQSAAPSAASWTAERRSAPRSLGLKRSTNPLK